MAPPVNRTNRQPVETEIQQSQVQVPQTPYHLTAHKRSRTEVSSSSDDLPSQPWALPPREQESLSPLRPTLQSLVDRTDGPSHSFEVKTPSYSSLSDVPSLPEYPSVPTISTRPPSTTDDPFNPSTSVRRQSRLLSKALTPLQSRTEQHNALTYSRSLPGRTKNQPPVESSSNPLEIPGRTLPSPLELPGRTRSQRRDLETRVQGKRNQSKGTQGKGKRK